VAFVGKNLAHSLWRITAASFSVSETSIRELDGGVQLSLHCLPYTHCTSNLLLWAAERKRLRFGCFFWAIVLVGLRRYVGGAILASIFCWGFIWLAIGLMAKTDARYLAVRLSLAGSAVAIPPDRKGIPADGWRGFSPKGPPPPRVPLIREEITALYAFGHSRRWR
jgi:hypothetical protein